MTHRPRKATLIRWAVEVICILVLLGVTVDYFVEGWRTFGVVGWTIFGRWDTIVYVEGAIFAIVVLGISELTNDPRLHRRVQEYVHPAISRMVGWSGVLLFLATVIHLLGIQQFNTLILVDVSFFLVDVTGLCLVVALFRVRLRLNQGAPSRHEPHQ